MIGVGKIRRTLEFQLTAAARVTKCEFPGMQQESSIFTAAAFDVADDRVPYRGTVYPCWLVRPVTGSSSTSVDPEVRFRTQYRVSAGLPSSLTFHSLSSAKRPIGAEIVP